MKVDSFRRLGSLAVILLLCLSCTPATPPPTQVPTEARPAYRKDFITLHLKADPQLNQYAGTSHALHLCVYQLIDPNPFSQFSEDIAGISKLMNCERFEAGVALAKRIIVQPGDDITEPLDRAEGARYVGIVAGYYTMGKQQVTRLYPIPTVEERRNGQIITRQSPLDIELYLGPQSIQASR